MISVNDYVIPVSKKLLQSVDRSSSPAHIGKLRNAVDFIAPIDTPVLAAAEGVVTFVNDGFDVGESDTSYWWYTNFVTIQHNNGEFSRYDHLKYKSSKVSVNQRYMLRKR